MPWYNELTKSEGSGVRPGTSGTGDPNLRDGGLSFIYSIDIVIDIVIAFSNIYTYVYIYIDIDIDIDIVSD